MKRAFDRRLGRVDVYNDLYRWIIIELMKMKREAMHNSTNGKVYKLIDGVDTASGCGAKPHTVPSE